jgi:WD40 repeat protein
MLVLSHLKQSVDALAFSPDGSTLATGGTSEKAGVQLWNLATQSRADPPPPVPAAVYNLLWIDHPSRMLVVGTRGFGTYFLRPLDNVLAIIRPPSSFLLAGAGPRDKVWSTERASPAQPGLVQARIDVRGQLQDIWRSPLPSRGWVSNVLEILGGRQILSLEYVPEGDGYIGSYRLLVRSQKTGEELARLDYACRDRGVLATTPDGRLFAASSRTKIWAWKADEGFPRLAEIRNDGRLHFTALAFHPSGRYLAATNNDATVKLYDTASWQLAKTFIWDIGKMRSIAFSPDGTLAAAGSDAGKVVIWDIDI